MTLTLNRWESPSWLLEIGRKGHNGVNGIQRAEPAPPPSPCLNTCDFDFQILCPCVMRQGEVERHQMISIVPRYFHEYGLERWTCGARDDKKAEQTWSYSGSIFPKKSYGCGGGGNCQKYCPWCRRHTTLFPGPANCLKNSCKKIPHYTSVTTPPPGGEREDRFPMAKTSQPLLNIKNQPVIFYPIHPLVGNRWYLTPPPV